MSTPPLHLLRATREKAAETGGEVKSMVTSWDPERGGRVAVITVFWPEQLGYESAWR